MIDRPEQILSLFKQYPEGLTVKRVMELGGGTELRKNVTILRRRGIDIRDRWKNVSGRRFKLYYLVQEQKVEKEPEIAFKREPLEGKALEKWQQTRRLFK